MELRIISSCDRHCPYLLREGYLLVTLFYTSGVQLNW
jgi:hypothetical protein